MGHPPAAAKSLRWILASILAGSITLSLGYLVYQCHRNPDIAFIFPGREAHWIQYPPTIKTQAKLPNRDVITFRKKFNLENRPQPPVQIYFQALKEAELWVNGRKLWQTPPGFNWKERGSVEISDALKAGPNVVEVHVRHRLGPPLLYLYSRGGMTPALATGSAWESARNGASWKQAVVADDTRFPIKYSSPKTPFEIFSLRRKPLLVFFAAATVLLFILERLLKAASLYRFIPIALFVFIGLLWTALYTTHFQQIPLDYGYDGIAHLDYIRYLLTQRRLPWAEEGWSMFHPPLFYLTAASLTTVLTTFAGKESALRAVKLIPFVCAFGQYFLVFCLGRILYPKADAQRTVLLFSAILIPMNIYLGCYLSNEPMHAFLAGSAIVLTLVCIKKERIKVLDIALLSLCLALAILTKVTSVLLIPIIGLVLVLKLRFLENRHWSEAWALAGAFVFLFLAATGWYFVRNLQKYGSPLVFNINESWWQDPGFHTPRYYRRFGMSLIHPYFAGFASCWDAVYCTLWGDGYVGGRSSFALAELFSPWNYDYMSLTYVWALPAVFFFVMGCVKLAGQILRSEPKSSLTAFFISLTLYAYFWTILYSTFLVPIYSQYKSFYLLACFSLLAILLAEGISSVWKKIPVPLKPPFQLLFYGWSATLAYIIWMSYLG